MAVWADIVDLLLPTSRVSPADLLHPDRTDAATAINALPVLRIKRTERQAVVAKLQIRWEPRYKLMHQLRNGSDRLFIMVFLILL